VQVRINFIIIINVIFGVGNGHQDIQMETPGSLYYDALVT
jgi:hypothetical protein